MKIKKTLISTLILLSTTNFAKSFNETIEDVSHILGSHYTKIGSVVGTKRNLEEKVSRECIMRAFSNGGHHLNVEVTDFKGYTYSEVNDRHYFADTNSTFFLTAQDQTENEYTISGNTLSIENLKTGEVLLVKFASEEMNDDELVSVTILKRRFGVTINAIRECFLN